MAATSDDRVPLMYPAPLDPRRDEPIEAGADVEEIETPILVVGGGPVGMLQALMFARIHNQECMMIERENDTTIYPKMEYTNGRSMEIYRQMGLADEFRKLATQYVPEDTTADELTVTSILPEGRLIHNWRRLRAVDHRRESKETNDGSRYLEPHLRAHQILVERWLKMWLQRETKIDGRWGLSFLGLKEMDDCVISTVQQADGTKLKIKSQYVIGCDGGGSWVRKSAGLESKRNYLDLTVGFVHLESKGLRDMLQFGRFWHSYTIHGGLIVCQDEDSTFSIHFFEPPGMDVAKLSTQELVNLACAGTLPPQAIPVDKVYSRGIWKVDVAIADKFRSDKGRVFLAGDSAHQLSPIGGHGLNSGLADAYDLAWKLVAHMRGWAGEQLLQSYDFERRQIAYKNLATVQQSMTSIVLPLMSIPDLDVNLINGDSPQSQQFRAKLDQGFKENSWLHDQNGNMLGYQYVDSPVVLAGQETVERQISDKDIYKPTTYPGSRAPHIWLAEGQTSILDEFDGRGFTLVDFSSNAASSEAFSTAAAKLKIPFKVLRLDAQKEANAAKVYERPLVLVRPCGHVAWRAPDAQEKVVEGEEVMHVLKTAVGL